MLCMPSSLLLLLPTLAFASRSSSKHVPDASCVESISSLDDVAKALQCRTININPFKVPGGQTLILKTKLDNVVMNLLGDLEFEVHDWEGALMVVGGKNIQFNGGNYTLNAHGEKYCQHPRSIIATGVFRDLVILNTPAQAVSIQNDGALLVKNIIIDDSAGDSGGMACNTDGFDVTNSVNLTLDGCTVYNQDDCVALNHATNTVIKNLMCSRGHGISIGSIQTGQRVSNVLVKDNVIQDSEQCFRIKAVPGAKNAYVENITYSGNICTNATKFGVLFQQNYQNGGHHLDTKQGLSIVPVTTVTFNDIKFIGKDNIVSVASAAWRLAGTCAPNQCLGWSLENLKISGGLAGKLINTGVDSFVSLPSADNSSFTPASTGSLSTGVQPAPTIGSSDPVKGSDPSSVPAPGNKTAAPTAADSSVRAASVTKTPVRKPPKLHKEDSRKPKHHGHRGSHVIPSSVRRLTKRRLEDISFSAD
ncbi:BQ2448_3172 [Microbotryum intermedium]|uniref:endo-polygalacturonase n=1 Tax=Microbotryum intermedium TaxID=269621 RepID=A0A238FI87_9BASI|nr:BQ2448_3172 [Microbotryum intermedium]